MMMMKTTKVRLFVLLSALPISLALQSLYVRPSHQLYTGSAGGGINGGSWKMMPDEPMPEVWV
jgi:hypothetical protein